MATNTHAQPNPRKRRPKYRGGTTRRKKPRKSHPDALAYSIDEAAHVLGLSRTTFYEFISEGRVNTYKVKARRLVDRNEVARLHEELKAEGQAA